MLDYIFKKSRCLWLCFFITFAHSENIFSQTNWLKLNNLIEIEPKTFISETEVSIGEWIDFLESSFYNKGDLFPDFSVLSNSSKLVFEDLLNNHGAKYLKFDTLRLSSYPLIRDVRSKPNKKAIKQLNETDSIKFSLELPITGISYFQALKFCKWKELLLSKRHDKNISVSLPSSDQYKRWIPNIDSIGTGKCYLMNVIKCNCKDLSKKDDYGMNKGKYLMEVYSFFYDDHKLYCMQGNAAEMTSTENIAKGGSYLNYGKDTYSDKIQFYSKPESWLGFRYVVIVNN